MVGKRVSNAVVGSAGRTSLPIHPISLGRCIVCGEFMPGDHAGCWFTDGHSEERAAGYSGFHMGCEGAYKRGARDIGALSLSQACRQPIAGGDCMKGMAKESEGVKPEQTYKVTMELTGKQVVLVGRGIHLAKFADTLQEPEAEEVWQIFYNAVAEVAGEW